MTTASRSTRSHPATSRRGRLVPTLAAATLAPVAVWLVARATGTELEVELNGQAPMIVGLPLVIGSALAASLAGWGVLSLLTRVTSRPAGVWTLVGLTTLVLSMVPPAVADAGTATRAYLMAMHVAVAAVLIPGLRRTTARSAS